MKSQVKVGAASQFAGVTVFPLFQTPIHPVDYQLFDDATQLGTVVVKEASDAGVVAHLIVENQGAIRILFLEGEHLVGAKQNRVLNTSVLAAAGAATNIPVSCVEQGRWRYASQQFQSSVLHSSPKLRRTLKATVTASLRTRKDHRSDQGRIWAEVSRQQNALNVTSETLALSDTLATHTERVGEFQNKLNYIDIVPFSGSFSPIGA